jgi:hypothetical protein
MVIKPYYSQHGDESIESGYTFWCPGCFERHGFRLKAPNTPCPWRQDRRWPVWTFEGTVIRPTFNPSLLISTGAGFWNVDGHWQEIGAPREVLCHLYLKGGVLQFLGDCPHHLKGTDVPIASLPGDREGQIRYKVAHTPV